MKIRFCSQVRILNFFSTKCDNTFQCFSVGKALCKMANSYNNYITTVKNPKLCISIVYVSCDHLCTVKASFILNTESQYSKLAFGSAGGYQMSFRSLDLMGFRITSTKAREGLRTNTLLRATTPLSSPGGQAAD